MMTEKEKNVLAMKAYAFNSIAEIVGNPWEYCGETKEEDNFRVATLGAVYGIAVHTIDVCKALQKGENDEERT